MLTPILSNICYRGYFIWRILLKGRGPLCVCVNEGQRLLISVNLTVIVLKVILGRPVKGMTD